MLENPRNKEFDVYVLDEVFPDNEHSEFLKLIKELNGDWKKRIDDLDVFWFAWDEEHRGRKYLMRLLDIAKDYFDLSSAIGYETWIRMSTRPRDWHRDHDDRLEMTTGELKYPICTTCYYPYVADNVKDGRLCFENGTIVYQRQIEWYFLALMFIIMLKNLLVKGFQYYLTLGMNHYVKLRVMILGGGIWYD